MNQNLNTNDNTNLKDRRITCISCNFNPQGGMGSNSQAKLAREPVAYFYI